MRFEDGFLTFIIILFFGILIIYNLAMYKIKEAGMNWDKNRCKPEYMPFAKFFGHNPQDNFNYCVKKEQQKNMSVYLEPINQALVDAEKNSSGTRDNIRDVRVFLHQLRNELEINVKRVFTVFLGTISPLQQILIKFKDLTMKMVASMGVMLYMTDGANKTLVSAWNSDAGGVLRTMCFHPETLVNMSDGSLEYMKNIKIGDKLKMGGEVLGTLTLKGNGKDNPFYMLYDKVGQQYVYVTGSHLIYDKSVGTFVKVEDYKGKAVVTEKTSPYMCCLITSTHLIKVGQYLFWDWEDGDWE